MGIQNDLGFFPTFFPIVDCVRCAVRTEPVLRTRALGEEDTNKRRGECVFKCTVTWTKNAVFEFKCSSLRVYAVTGWSK